MAARTGSGELSRLLGKLLRARGKAQALPDVRPGCAFGVVVEERLKNMERHLAEMHSRLNGLFYLVVGAVVVEVVLRLVR